MQWTDYGFQEQRPGADLAFALTATRSKALKHEERLESPAQVSTIDRHGKAQGSPRPRLPALRFAEA